MNNLTVNQALNIIEDVFIIQKKSQCGEMLNCGGERRFVCAYWAEQCPHGCAVGVLLTEEQRKFFVKEKFMTVSVEKDNFRKYAPQLDNLPLEFLVEVQTWHDFRLTNYAQAKEHFYSKIKPRWFKEEKCLCGGRGCNSCEPQGRG